MGAKSSGAEQNRRKQETNLPTTCLQPKILAIEPQKHFRHAVVAVGQNVSEVLAAFDCVLSDANERSHGACAGDLEVGGVAAAAVAFAIEV